MTTYELLVVLEATRTEDEQTQSLDRIEEIITKNGGTITKRDVWGKRRLAYQIERRREGHYTLIHFEAGPTSPVLAEVNRHLRITEEILRFLITRAVLDKSRGVAPSESQIQDQRYGGPRVSRRPPESTPASGEQGTPQAAAAVPAAEESTPAAEGEGAGEAPASAEAEAPAEAAAPAPKTEE